MTLELYAELVQAVVSDARLSPDARVLVLHVLGKGDGPHEIPKVEVSGVLSQAKDRRIADAQAQATAFGWLIYEWRTGRGHHPSYQFRDARQRDATDGSACGKDLSDGSALRKDPSDRSALHADLNTADRSAFHKDLSDRSAPNADLNEEVADRSACGKDPNGPHVRDHGDQKTSSSPSSSAGAQVRGGQRPSDASLKQLRDVLDPAAHHVIETFAASADHRPGWPSAIATAYLGPQPLDHKTVAGVPPPDRPRLVGLAMSRYAADGAAFDARYFKRFLETVIDEESVNGDDSRTTSSRTERRSGSRRTAGAVAGEVSAAYDRLSE